MQIGTPSPPTAGSRFRPSPRPLKLSHLLFLLLLVPGIVPLLISSSRLIGENREILKTQQKELLTHFAQGFADELGGQIARRREQLEQLGRGLVASPGAANLEGRLRREWVTSYLSTFASEHQRELLAFQVLAPSGGGPQANMETLAEDTTQRMTDAVAEARETGAPVYSFAAQTLEREPAVVVTVPVATPSGSESLVVQAMFRMPLPSLGLDLDELFLIDGQGERLWSAGSHPAIEQALLDSDLVQGDSSLQPLGCDIRAGSRSRG